MKRNPNRYSSIILEIFKKHYKRGKTEFTFDRAEIESVARRLRIVLPKNFGDLIYSFRYRIDLPDSIKKKAPKGKEWTIELAGKARYRFKLTGKARIVPRSDLATVKIPDATPEIIAKYALNDEQALLAIVRYNRLIDIFLGITVYSLQSHMRTTVKDLGQIEIDEMYVGVDKQGRHYVVPIQAKGGSDQLGAVQSKQDIYCCREKFPNLICRAISAQFMETAGCRRTIALFEVAEDDGEIKVVEERHYRLVPAKEIADEDLKKIPPK